MNAQKQLAVPAPPTLWRLFVSAFFIGLFSFGGGLAVWMLREFVDSKRWVSEAEFMNDFAIARLLPGGNVSNLMLIIGYKVLGLTGALVGLLALMSAPFIIIFGLYFLYDSLAGPVMTAAVEGASAGAIGLTAVMVERSIRHMGRAWYTWFVCGGVTVAMALFHLPILLVVAVAIPTSMLLVMVFKRNG